MTAVLLVADTERVKRLFAELEGKGVLHLHAAATVTEVDQVLAQATPALAFVQSRMSGLSPEILLRHLKKSLPESAKVVLLCADAADMPRKQVRETPPVDLRLADDKVAETVAGIVAGIPSPTAKGCKSAAGGKNKRRTAPRSKKDGHPGPAGSPSPRPAAAAVAAFPSPCPAPAGCGGTEVEGGGNAIAEEAEPPEAEPPEAEPPEAEPRPHAADLLTVEDQSGEEPLGRGKRSKALWPLLLLLAFFLVPLTAYLLGRVVEAPEKEAPRQPGEIAAGRSGLLAAPSSATSRPPIAAATGTHPEAPGEGEGSRTPGLSALPPFLEGVEVDRGYGAGHPGWEQYLGAKAEYRVFREGGRYRALQAIARGEEIPDHLFKRVLLEFGGIAGYAVKSTEAKGGYLVEQAVGSGSASLTIYRKINDHRIKGLVVYYH